MKVKILNYLIINKLKPNQKNIFDITIIEDTGSMVQNTKFENKENRLHFIVKNVGHINPPQENYYILTIESSGEQDFEKYKNLIFTSVE